ncbi:hypothetical protein [Ensifer adhaerens]|uniref:hypothetical protein n=1 Tax=Ensifer adhaerens TaxID=106592 RepID=UPI00202FEB35|nr:hypothetical protein [Ensifer adhaerens]
MTKVNIGIIGTGFLAKILAPEIQSSSKARLAAVSSRTLAKAPKISSPAIRVPSPSRVRTG